MFQFRSFTRFASPVRIYSSQSLRNYSNKLRTRFYLPCCGCMTNATFSNLNYKNNFVNKPSTRFYSSKSSDDPLGSGNGSDSSSTPDDPGSSPETPPGPDDPQMVQMSLTPFAPPENFPIVPVIAVNKHPVFPGFVKIVEVSNLSI